MTSPSHVPVALERVLELLAPAVEAAGDRAVVVDTTLGLGGHSRAFLETFPRARVIGIDRDPHALRIARERLAQFGERFTAAEAVYDDIARVVAEAGAPTVSAVLFDLGVSSMQLDEADRGFAYAQDAPLDMRMDASGPVTAADVLNEYDARDLARVLRVYGEEKFAKRIADNVVRAREVEPFTTSARLVDLVRESIPQAARRTGGNPAKRTFQALRIEVNDELRVYERALPAALDVLDVSGRVVVLSYHSLEDRITKRRFSAVTTSTAPRDLPIVPADQRPRFTLLTRGAEVASPAEIEANPRAASVRVRAVERVAAA
ncbi:MAG: 16S rRNA (cytosine(1402)-N(4))-methyltransferase RsmH [Aeromicrobium sp.]|uniref:16S rRNA (cytosine(1402)-N(4))-methyltransferase RsmH n=1 Tax=Aeromicrobium sp. TaxID=1871063 RepID=UPI0025BA7614|nr:16S rRNA (cytosine(1402)-N(4))-methyltransferase RsmH [Aeromicrobium sp.]MCK5890592.1 16S rRNA (cytosine(1402)-N(4))-methyltransferase RsmH [Aeromicrobium sp.]MDF1703439.1 16S rRNA (cytosine(1402)-N(4))-methyltransferase RsmH [Aeromicrobium sp.]